MIKYILLSFLLIGNTLGINENELRINLFKNYNKNNRPVLNISDNVLLNYGLQIEDLNYFNQKSENIEITMKKILIWKDEYLKWDLDYNTPKYITVGINSIWKPDLELYNAASKPKIYNKNPTVKIFNDGVVEFIEVLSYKFACKLNFDNFPFDEQTCNMLFGSWKYPKNILDIKPFYKNNFKNFSISESFSHNEWNIVDINVVHTDNTYKCCPGDLWPNSDYSITFKRNPHKYNILIVMSVFITLSALTINSIYFYIYRRTYILVFIPLTLIWLQIHTSSKIPVIKESTKLENIIMCCFFTTIISCFESGVLYCIINNYYKFLGNYFKINNYNKIKAGYHLLKEKPIKNHNLNYKNMDFIKVLNIFSKIDGLFRILLTILFTISIIILINKN